MDISIDIDSNVTTTSTTRRELQLDRDKILLLLRNGGVTIPEQADVTVHFSIPGGGDWSNTDLDVTKEHPVYVIWTVQTVRKTDG